MADSIAVEMGRRIAQARKRKRWTQLQLAQATGWSQADADAGNSRGLSPSRIANYEQGARRISNEEAAMLSVLGHHPAYLLAVVDEQQDRVLMAMEER